VNYSIENVSKDFFAGRSGGTRALHGVSLVVPAGEHLSVLGSSGSGKTTLFRLLNATLRPTRGSVRVDGCDFSEMSTGELRGARRRIGTIYQQHNLVPSLTSLQNTLCGSLGRWSMAQTLRSIFYPAATDVQEAMHALELVGLADKRFSRADELSGGQQQRLAIARVLMQKPEVILADEPIASLDRALADEIISLLIRVGAQGKRTLIVALHKVELALEHFPRVIGLGEGRMRFDLPSNSVHDDVLQDLYGKHGPDSHRVQDENNFQREFGCSR
jgi:phosphonate transport system ATP-binding protein